MGNTKKNISTIVMNKGNRTLNLFFSKITFIGSFTEISNLPNHNLPECCLIGRTNVGKSSLINAMTNSKNIAKTSKTPGRTQALNYYNINKKIQIVDLPGYGYSKISIQLRNYISQLFESYLINRRNLKTIYVLIDCNIGIKEIDINTFDMLADAKKSFSIILTKIDKCSKNFIISQKKSILTLLNNYSNYYVNTFAVSCKKHVGIIDIQKDIFALTRI